MGNFKINSPEDCRNFIPTNAYKNLLSRFRRLKKEHGIILHVMGAPGTGKSTNIYQAVDELSMDVFIVRLILDKVNTSPKEVFNSMIATMKVDLKVNNNQALVDKLEKFDALIFADEFHDSHLLIEGKIGFSQWTEKYGWRSFYFYGYCVKEYLKNRDYFRNINLVLQTAWRVKIGGHKKDLFTDFGFISRIFRILLRIPFQVVEISYSPEETEEIVNQHITDADEHKIKELIEIYGCKPRIICEHVK